MIRAARAKKGTIKRFLSEKGYSKVKIVFALRAQTKGTSQKTFFALRAQKKYNKKLSKQTKIQ